MAVWLHYSPKVWFGKARPINLDVSPAPAVLAGGLGGSNLSHYTLIDDMQPSPSPTGDKPPYRVPTMAEIDARPWNGLTVASTFSGCGGSCLGYRMAGFRVAWANEFVPIAQESYRLNAPITHLDPRDVRLVKGSDVLAACPGGVDLFDGSPPCQAFSTAGKRDKNWGKTKTYAHGAKQCNEALFDEYVRLVGEVRPKVFVAENVSGLVKGRVKGQFLLILQALKRLGYRVEVRMLDAQWLGVPQARQRLFFVGVRDDLKRNPVFPSPLPYRYSVRDGVPWVSGLQRGGAFNLWSDATRPASTVVASGATVSPTAYFCGHMVEVIVGNDNFKPRWGAPETGPSPTVLSSGPHGGSGEFRSVVTKERRKFTIPELLRICGFPDDFQLAGSFAQQWERLGNSVPPVMMYHLAVAIRDHILN